MTRLTIKAALPIVIAALGACTTAPKGVVRAGSPTVEVIAKADRWLAVASPIDQSRINRLAPAWQGAIAEARRRGFADEMRAEGKLLAANGALARPAPTPGSYSCRLVTLGRSSGRGPAFEKFKPFFCYVDLEGDLFTIVKQTGSSRPAGRLWDDDIATRLIFLGSIALGNNEEAIAYGDDPKRDMAGVFERIAPFRWRLVIPFPQDGATLHVYELTPVAEQPAP